jgi:hypothetical protein
VIWPVNVNYLSSVAVWAGGSPRPRGKCFLRGFAKKRFSVCLI